MGDITSEYKALKNRYQECEKRLTVAKAEQTKAKKELPKLEAEIMKLAHLDKFAEDKVDAFMDKLDKELETRIATLRDKVREFESRIAQLKLEKLGADVEEDTFEAAAPKDEDIDEIFDKI